MGVVPEEPLKQPKAVAAQRQDRTFTGDDHLRYHARSLRLPVALALAAEAVGGDPAVVPNERKEYGCG